jgi:hypothetical protein
MAARKKKSLANEPVFKGFLEQMLKKTLTDQGRDHGDVDPMYYSRRGNPAEDNTDINREIPYNTPRRVWRNGSFPV